MLYFDAKDLHEMRILILSLITSADSEGIEIFQQTEQ